jgi:hypothetical protein
LKAYEAGLGALQGAVAEIDAALARSARRGVADEPARLEALLRLREALSLQQQRSTPPLSVVAFYLNPQILFWPGLYSSLICLVWVLRPSVPRPSRRDFATIVALGAGIYVFYDWPLWLRNFWLSNQARTIYAFSNYDVDRASFIAQELTIIGFSLLLATLWWQWSHAASPTIRRGIGTRPALARACDVRLSADVGRAFVRWQVNSVVLAAGFLFATNFYWTIVKVYGDPRYLLSALLIHFLWGVTWMLISLPVLTLWNHWHAIRGAAMAELLASDRGADDEWRASVLAEMRPLGTANLSLSAVSAFGSFLLPLVRLAVG